MHLVWVAGKDHSRKKGDEGRAEKEKKEKWRCGRSRRVWGETIIYPKKRRRIPRVSLWICRTHVSHRPEQRFERSTGCVFWEHPGVQRHLRGLLFEASFLWSSKEQRESHLTVRSTETPAGVGLVLTLLKYINIQTVLKQNPAVVPVWTDDTGFIFWTTTAARCACSCRLLSEGL